MNNWTTSLIALVLIAGVFGAGMFVSHYKTFPYGLIQNAIRSIKDTLDPSRTLGPWTIGVYRGNDLFHLTPANASNPVIDGAHAEAWFVGDPFVVTLGDVHYLFYEALVEDTDRGEIAYSYSSDLEHWTYGGRIIKEDFHLSYPHVFQHDGNYYLVPESYEDFSVRLYRAKSFPDEWEYERDLIGGFAVVDPTLFQHDGKWWMFVTTGKNEVLNLYYSNELEHGWVPHPMNPIVKNDKRIARSAGRVVTLDGKLYRFAQDCHNYYGERVYAVEITKLTPTEYAEQPNFANPVVEKTSRGWNAAGMHHVEFVTTEGQLTVVTDGKFRP